MSANSDFRIMVARDEKILWAGKPDKKCYFFEGIFNPMLPFALVWALVDFTFFGVVSSSLLANNNIVALLPIIGFFLLHLMPVWLYLVGIIFIFLRYKNTEYMITDSGVYISGGLFARTYQMKPFAELSHINLHRGIFDQWLGVGDIIMSSNIPSSSNFSFSEIMICDIANYQRVFNLVKELQTDIYSDTMYPNDLRPAQNHGYKTQYKKNL